MVYNFWGIPSFLISVFKIWPGTCYFRLDSPGSNFGWGPCDVAFEQDTSSVMSLPTLVYLCVLVNLILGGRGAVSSAVMDCYPTKGRGGSTNKSSQIDLSCAVD